MRAAAGSALAAAVLAGWLGGGCGTGPAGEVPAAGGSPAARSASAGRQLDPPAVPESLAPNLALAGDRLYLSWLEPASLPAGAGHRLRIAWLEGDGWSEPRTVVEGDDFFANWADFPAVARAPGGALVTHWLARTGDDTYAYNIFLARSNDGGQSWSRLGPLSDDDSPTEHGFVSYAAEGDGLRAFWLDGRAMMRQGPMQLRSAAIGEVVGASELLDERVCDCCSTAAAVTATGPVVVYRDRSAGEIRDIARLRRLPGGGWQQPAPLAADGWEIAGCPVNGPEIAAAGKLAAVAWFTAAGGAPAVRVAFSSDAGNSFTAPLTIDDGSPLGRVDVVLDGGGGAVVSWLTVPGDQASLRLRRVLADGRMGEPLDVAATGASRASGFPRLARRGGTLYLVWIDTAQEGAARIRMRAIPLDGLPLPS